MTTHTEDPRPTSSPLHLQGRVLPEGEVRDIWVADGRISREPVGGSETIASGGWILPALVDAHVHLGIAEIGGPLDFEVLHDDVRQLARSGVGAARILGSPERLPAHMLSSPGKPLLLTAGVPVAAIDRFIPGWGRRVPDRLLAQACADEARCGWSKIIADWFGPDGGYGPSFSAHALEAAVSAVHGIGARVAVHAQSSVAGARAAAAGVDSIEHGMNLPPSALDDLAVHGGFLVPTGFVFEQLKESMLDSSQPADLRTWFAEGLENHPDVVIGARDRGIPVLAGTDLPVGALVDEVVWLHRAGLSAHDAVGAASWASREVLDLSRLRHGDRADLIWFAHDPRDDLEMLRSAELAVIGGEVSTATP